MNLHYRKYGSGEPLVILHGLFGSSINWNTIGKYLAKYFTVYIVDQRNHGKSFHSEQFNYSLLSKDLLSFLLENKLENVNLLGHSMGGKTALRFAFDNPEKVNKLIVVDIGLKEFKFKDRALLDAMCSLDLKLIRSRKEIDDHLSGKIIDIGLRQFIMQNIHRSINGGFAWRMNFSVLTKEIDQVGSQIIVDKVFDKPSLFIRGEKSDYILDLDKLEIGKWFSNVKFDTIVDAGHWVHFDKPKEFIETVEIFLNE